MNDATPDLSTRYYIAESSVWLLGGILTVARFVGLAPSQAIPFLNVTPEKQQYLPRILALLLFACSLYLLVEWQQSIRSTRVSFWAKARKSATILWACVALWLSYPLFAHGTRFANVSPAWYFIFIAIGFLISSLASTIVYASLMIRTPGEAKTVQLPRVPYASRAQYRTWIPIVLILIAAYYALWQFAPDAIKVVAPPLVAIPYLFMLLKKILFLFFSYDETGHRVPYGKRIERLRRAFDFHDYCYILNGHGAKQTKALDLTMSSPQAIQKAMQDKYAVNPPQGLINFHVQQIDEVQIQFYSKDGNPKNGSLDNAGVRIIKRNGDKGIMRVLLIPDDALSGRKEMLIPVNLVETNAEQYLRTHPREDDRTFRAVFSYAINETVIKTMLTESGSLLHRAVEAGQEDLVRDLLGKKDTNVNEQAEFGWTALLYASAQGYPSIVRTLLEAGANPDLGNVHGITPIMYGARYGNTDVTRLLIDFHAKIDIQDAFGHTALMVATLHGHDVVAEMLLDAGADSRIRDHQSKTALDIAYANKRGAIAKRIRGADKPGKRAP